MLCLSDRIPFFTVSGAKVLAILQFSFNATSWGEVLS